MISTLHIKKQKGGEYDQIKKGVNSKIKDEASAQMQSEIHLKSLDLRKQ